jgi:hypothetical protein
MNKCSICGTDEGIVFSGVDAFLLGCMDRIEKICYSCANEEARKVNA